MSDNRFSVFQPSRDGNNMSKCTWHAMSSLLRNICKRTTCSLPLPCRVCPVVQGVTGSATAPASRSVTRSAASGRAAQPCWSVTARCTIDSKHVCGSRWVNADAEVQHCRALTQCWYQVPLLRRGFTGSADTPSTWAPTPSSLASERPPRTSRVSLPGAPQSRASDNRLCISFDLSILSVWTWSDNTCRTYD